MNFKDRLNRLIPISKTDQSRTEVLNDLRKRLNRLLEPKKIYTDNRGRNPWPDGNASRDGDVVPTSGLPTGFHREKVILPIEQLVKGEVVSSADGETFQAKKYFPSDFRYGEMELSEILNIPTYPAHLLSRDEQLKELDFRKTLFLDTETTGLTGGTGTFAFMIGLGFFQGDEFLIHQLFMRDYSEERASLSILKELLGPFQFLITFNGKHYDIPLLETRFILSRTTSRIKEMPNFDLLFPCRKIWKGAYENCRLITLESQLLGVERGDDVPSEWIPYLYFDYLRTGDARKIHQVFYHNQMDILTMVALAGRIHLVYHDPQAARPRKGIEHFALGRLFWDHGRLEKAIPCFEIALNRCDEDLAWEVMKWLSRAFRKTGRVEKARSLWEEMVAWHHQRDVFPYVELAKYYEHRIKDVERAIVYVNRALEQTSSDQRKEIEPLRHRRSRLEMKRVQETMNDER